MIEYDEDVQLGYMTYHSLIIQYDIVWFILYCCDTKNIENENENELNENENDTGNFYENIENENELNETTPYPNKTKPNPNLI